MTGDSRLLGSNVMRSGKYLLTFQRNLLPPSSVCDLLTLLDETLCSFEMFGYLTLATAQYNIWEDNNPQHQCCDKPQISHEKLFRGRRQTCVCNRI